MPPAPTTPSTVDARKLYSHRYKVVSVSCGRTCGSTACVTTWKGEAPAALAASMGFGSACSIASAKNLPTIPTECRPRASTPGRAPNPTAATKKMPMMSSGTDRSALSAMRVARNTRGCGLVFGAASSPSGSESVTASAVPATLMAKVSTMGDSHDRQRVKSGGVISSTSWARAGTPSAKRTGSRRPTLQRHARIPRATGRMRICRRSAVDRA